MASDPSLCLLIFMSDQNNKAVFRCLSQQLDDLCAVLCVQVSGRFVRQKNGRRFRQRAGNGKSLFLAAGEPCRSATTELPQIYPMKDLICFLFGLFQTHTGQAQCADHITHDRTTGQNAIVLGNKADSVSAVPLPINAVIVGSRLTVKEHFAAFICQNAAQNMGQSRLTATAFAGDRHKFAPPEIQGHLVQTHSNILSVCIKLGQTTQG